MDDAHGYEERRDGSDGPQITANGDFLCVQHEGHPRHIYKRVPTGSEPHPLVSRKLHAGELYSLAWIEDDA